MSTSKDIQKYFTGFEEQIQFFRSILQSPNTSRKILAVYGIGGVGKSSLIKMYEVECEKNFTPYGFVSGNQSRSVIDLLDSWRLQLNRFDINLPKFSKSFQKYRLLQVKADEIYRESMGKIGQVAKTLAETTISLAPGGGAIASLAGGASMEILGEWLKNRFSKPDLDLILNPSQTLTSLFLDDVSLIPQKKRLVFFVDTFEQLPSLTGWFCSFIQQLRDNCIVVISGRKIPFDNTHWPEWLSNAYLQEISPSSINTIEVLATRYYATISNRNPDPEQIRSIAKFSRGLPLAATIAVQLWLERGVKNFQFVEEEATANLIDKLLERTTPKFMIALEAASVFRIFNKDNLRSMVDQVDIEQIYYDLRQLSFVYPAIGGFTLHDSVKEIIQIYLKKQDNNRYKELHQKAIDYFSQKDDNYFFGDILYHHLCIHEGEGVKIFYQLFYTALRSSKIELCEILLNEASAFPAQIADSRGWILYCQGLMDFVKNNMDGISTAWEGICNNESLGFDLRATAEHGLGVLYYRLGELEKSQKHFERAIKMKEVLGDNRLLASTLSELSKIYRLKSEWKKTIEVYKKTAKIFKKFEEHIEYADSILQMAVTYRLQGYWRKSEKLSNLALQIFQSQNNDHGKSRALFNLGWIHMLQGDLEIALERFNLCINLAQANNAQHIVAVALTGKGNTFRLMKNWEAAGECLAKSLEMYTDMNYKVNIGIVKGNMGELFFDLGDLDKAESLYNESIKISEDSGNEGNLSINLERLSRLMIAKKDLNSSLELSKRTLQLSEKVNYVYVNCQAQLNLLKSQVLVNPDFKFSEECLARKQSLAKKYHQLGYNTLTHEIESL